MAPFKSIAMSKSDGGAAVRVADCKATSAVELTAGAVQLGLDKSGKLGFPPAQCRHIPSSFCVVRLRFREAQQHQIVHVSRPSSIPPAGGSRKAKLTSGFQRCYPTAPSIGQNCSGCQVCMGTHEQSGSLLQPRAASARTSSSVPLHGRGTQAAAESPAGLGLPRGVKASAKGCDREHRIATLRCGPVTRSQATSHRVSSRPSRLRARPLSGRAGVIAAAARALTPRHTSRTNTPTCNTVCRLLRCFSVSVGRQVFKAHE